MHPLIAVLDLLLSFVDTQRGWFWIFVAVIVIGLIAVIANLMEPSRASF